MPLVYLARKLTRLLNVKIVGILGDMNECSDHKDRRVVKGVNLVCILLCLIYNLLHTKKVYSKSYTPFGIIEDLPVRRRW